MEAIISSFFIVECDRRYLQTAVSPKKGSLNPYFSIYKYDAWRTTDINKARAAARIVGGTVRRFFPLSGDVL